MPSKQMKQLYYIKYERYEHLNINNTSISI